MMTVTASMLLLPNVFAESTPATDRDNPNFFFANGTAITISAKDAGDGAVITWEGGGRQEVEANVTIFGGSHAEDVTTTSITMNGGKVKNIVGGGLHNAKTTTTNIVINGGEVTGQVVGGGASSFSGTTCHSWYSGDVANANNTVGTANITVNNGTIGTVYGGGEGISRTEQVTINIVNGTITNVIASGSNGYTGNANVNLNGGTIQNYFTVNRGQMDSAETIVDGATITNLYVGSDGEESGGWKDDGTIGSSSVEVLSGTVTNASMGYNGGTKSEGNKSAKEVGTLVFAPDTVENIKDNDMVTVTLNVLGEEISVLVAKGEMISEEELEETKNDIITSLIGSNYEFLGFFADEDLTEPFNFEEAINNDTTIYLGLKLIEVEDETEAENPNTSDTQPLLFMGMFLLSAFGICALKRNFN